MGGIVKDQVQSTFDELRGMSIVQRVRRVRRLRARFHPCLNFRAGRLIWPTRTILYSSRYADLGQNEARLVILHEEGHLALKQYSTPLMILTRSTIFVAAVMLLIEVGAIFLALLGVGVDFETVDSLGRPVGLVVAALAVVVVIAGVKGKKYLEIDEDNSDDFAATHLKKNFGIRCPSRVMRDLLNESRGPHSRLGRLWCTITSLGVDIHRDDEERVQRMRRLHDEPPC